jgi:hypothetical protein
MAPTPASKVNIFRLKNAAKNILNQFEVISGGISVDEKQKPKDYSTKQASMKSSKFQTATIKSNKGKSLSRHASLRASEKDPNLKAAQVITEGLGVCGEFRSEQIIPTGADVFRKKKTFKSDMDPVDFEFSGLVGKKHQFDKYGVSNQATESDKGSKKRDFLESEKEIDALKRKSEGD